jgi:hypothetical protein
MHFHIFVRDGANVPRDFAVMTVNGIFIKTASRLHGENAVFVRNRNNRLNHGIENDFRKRFRKHSFCLVPNSVDIHRKTPRIFSKKKVIKSY